MAHQWFLIPQVKVDNTWTLDANLGDLLWRSAWAPQPGSSSRYLIVALGEQDDLEALSAQSGVTRLPDQAGRGVRQAYEARTGKSMSQSELEAKLGVTP